MKRNDPVAGAEEDLTQVLGYLNFSAGRSDPKTLQALNRLFGRAIWGSPYAGMPPWLSIQQWLQDRLMRLAADNAAFRESSQAAEVLQLIWLHLLPSYLDFHRDLLFHQEPEALFNGFFLGRAMEAVLQQGAPWDEVDRIIPAAIQKLNDYVGFRPVAVLEGRRLEPYPHEWVRPVPLFIAGAGVTLGPYHEVVSAALQILEQTDPDILQRAYLDLSLMDELALDPRAYDFDHPVNRRPNYHFGQWDPHCIDGQGNYRRFVIQQVTLDALLARVTQDQLPKQELLFEAAAVLAGTILMASGICGSSPSTFPSTVNLAHLLPPIAKFRDEFYDQLIARVTGQHAARLQEEQAIRRQAFGGARQHLNQQLARQRASQLEHVQLARLFARMGSPQAAKDESDFVPVASARLLCRIDCLATAGTHALQQGKLEEAAAIPAQVMDLVQRGIQCGAIVDPWNILGFAGNFSRFHGPDSAVHDHRVDELVSLMEQIFALQSRIWREAAARDDQAICLQIEEQFRNTANWWRKYAAQTISDIQATDPLETYESASLVAKALRLWHAGGASAGDVRFWAPHAEMFDSPKAYALVVEALLERDDFVASMALLINWLCQVESVGLQSGSVSFSNLARQWLQKLELKSSTPDASREFGWPIVEKFFDRLEANADHYWQPPEFQLRSPKSPRSKPSELAGETSDPETPESVFDAAYEGVVYQDTTDDGTEGSIFEEEGATQDELQDEANRLGDHLNFLTALAQMWKLVALSPTFSQLSLERSGASASRLDALQRFCEHASANRTGLVDLLNDVRGHKVPRGGTDSDAMTRYDRRRLTKESLLDRIIATAVETADARQLLLAALVAATKGKPDLSPPELSTLDDRQTVNLFAELMTGDSESVKESFPSLLAQLRPQRLLYVPLARGGDPNHIFSVRLRRRLLTHLLIWLPRVGLFHQACQLVETARHMEHNNPVGPGAVTEFDELYKIAYKSLVRSLVRNAYYWQLQSTKGTRKSKVPHSALDDLEDCQHEGLLEPDSELLIPLLEQLTEVMLGSWLAHSRTLRLSILETVDNAANWKRLVEFIQRYGGSLFTQQFLKLTNVRAILHQGIGAWLDHVGEDGGQEEVQQLLEAIAEKQIDRTEAEKQLTIVLEGIIDHYAEYRDYNSTTTQSDRGEMLFMLLDFLRLRVRYDRVCWNLRPVFWSHEIMVRSGCQKAALHWRRALAERIGREADLYLEQLAKLQSKYAMRMPTVADRLSERFTKPMTIDRMRALIRPAVRQLRSNQDSPAFELLLEETRALTKEPTGVGLDVPAWLAGLEEEVERVLENERYQPIRPRYEQAVPLKFVRPQDMEEQLQAAGRQNRFLSPPEDSK